MTAVSLPLRLSSPLRRVVVTGVGAVTPLGNTVASTWSNLTGRCVDGGEGGEHGDDDGRGITTLERSLLHQGLTTECLDREMSLASSLPCRVAAPVRGVDRGDGRTARFAKFAVMAGREAAKSAGIDVYLGSDVRDDDEGESGRKSPPYCEEEEENGEEMRNRRDRSGCCIGSGMSSTRGVVEASRDTYPRGTVRRLTPHFIPLVLPNTASGRVSLDLGLRGPCHAVSTACASGAHAIGDAMRFIRYGDADVMLAGGAEAAIDPLSMGGFCRLRALSTTFNDRPKLSSRPFDEHRDGFVMGEGAAVLVLEELEHALARGAPILCELVGYGLSGDAHHITSPDPRGRGAVRAMRAALRDAGRGGASVDYVNAHATSTPLGDDIEAAAIGEALIRWEEEQGGVAADGGGGRERNLYVSSTKGMTGHLLGAAGALEAAFAALSIVDGMVPPTVNYGGGSGGTDDESSRGFRHVTGRDAVERDVRVVMSNSFGFGGTNASLVFVKYEGGE